MNLRPSGYEPDELPAAPPRDMLSCFENRTEYHQVLCPNRRLPILPGRYQPSTFGVCGLNCCVRYGNRWNPTAIATGHCTLHSALALKCDSSLIRRTQEVSVSCEYARSKQPRRKLCTRLGLVLPHNISQALGPISTSQLKTLLPLHSWPINLVIYKGSLPDYSVRDLISGPVSRLDAFSVYPFPT